MGYGDAGIGHQLSDAPGDPVDRLDPVVHEEDLALTHELPVDGGRDLLAQLARFSDRRLFLFPRQPQGRGLLARLREFLALDRKPDYAQAAYNLATVLAALRQWDEAAAQYEAAIRLDPRNADALVNLGNVRLVQTAPALGIREARRIRGDYVLTLEDAQAGRRFADAVTFGAFGVDIHEPAPGAGIPSGHHARMKPYEIPYRCLLPQGLDGLLTAGRCISGTHEAHASYRVTGTCMGMGQGAGVAAAWAAAENIAPRRLDGPKLRKRLEDLKCGFLA